MNAAGIFGFLGFFSVLSGAVSAAEPVTEDMFLDTHVGKCVSYAGPSDGRQCYEAGGATTYEDQRYGADTGTWVYRDGEICVTWEKEATEDCNAYTREADGTFSAATGYTWQIDD